MIPFIGSCFQYIYTKFVNYVYRVPSYITKSSIRRVQFDNNNIELVEPILVGDIFTQLDNWYRNYHITDDFNRTMHKKMQMWCLIQRINELKLCNGTLVKQGVVADADFVEKRTLTTARTLKEYSIITEIYLQMNAAHPEIVNEIHIELGDSI